MLGYPLLFVIVLELNQCGGKLVIPDEDIRFIKRAFVIAPVIVFILYLMYQNSHYIAGFVLVIASLFSIFLIYSSLDSGVFKIDRFDGAGQLEIEGEEKPIRFGLMVIINCVGVIFYGLVFYSNYVEDILNIPVP
jgi:hypothetical protein